MKKGDPQDPAQEKKTESPELQEGELSEGELDQVAGGYLDFKKYQSPFED